MDNKKLKHKITTHCTNGVKVQSVYRSLIKQAITMTLISEAVDKPCVVNVLITDDKGIRAYNNEYRGIDEATDVLSFPMQSFAATGWLGIAELEIDPDTQAVPLGDIVISTVTIKRNSRKYRRTIEQETTHMMIHSTLHLLGYGHSSTMRSKENTLLSYMGYNDGKQQCDGQNDED